MNLAREEMLERVRRALSRTASSPVPSPPPGTKVAPRAADEANKEIDLLLAEIDKLGGITRRIAGKRALRAALKELVQAEGVQKAAVWTTPELLELGIADHLTALGVAVISGAADKRQVAECDLGITTVDAALPETGTLLLRSSPERPRPVSLVPPVHLAILRPAALRPDLHQALGEVKGEGYFVFVTGPSRTADIELTLTIGVHGPKALYVWALA